MERGWWWKAALYGVVTVVAVLYLVPTLVPEEKQPSFIKDALPEADPARARPPGRPAPRLRGQRRQGGLGQGRPPVVGHRGPPAQGQGRQRRERRPRGPRRHHPHLQEPGRPGQARRRSSCATTASRSTWSSRDAATGVVRLRLDPDQVEEVRDYALRQGIETIRNRVDKLGVAEPTIIKKGTDIIVELPGLKPADFERIKTIIGRTAQLEFKIVDDGSEYMKKVAGARRRRRRREFPGIEVGPTAGPRRTRASRTRTSTCASKNRDDAARSSSPALTGDAGGPDRSRDRLRGDAGARRGRRGDARQATGAPTTCTSAPR